MEKDGCLLFRPQNIHCIRNYHSSKLEKESKEDGKTLFPFAENKPITKNLIEELDRQPMLILHTLQHEMDIPLTLPDLNKNYIKAKRKKTTTTSVLLLYALSSSKNSKATTKSPTNSGSGHF